MKQFYLILIISFICSFNTYSQKIQGAELTYNYLKNDSYQVTLVIYKSCKDVESKSIRLEAYSMSSGYSSYYLANHYMTPVTCKDVTNICRSSCSKCNSSKCNSNGYPNGVDSSCSFPLGIEKLVFMDTFKYDTAMGCKIKLLVRHGLWSTDNLKGSVSPIIHTVIDFCKAKENTSPVFLNTPEFIFCVNNCIGIDFQAVDSVDHDSLSYELSEPDTNAKYSGQYSYLKPLYFDGFPNVKYDYLTCKGIKIDSIIGVLLFKPMIQENVLIAIKVKEWRKDTSGNYINIGFVRREIVLNIISNCLGKSPILSKISKSICAGEIICYDSITTSGGNINDSVWVEFISNLNGAKFKSQFENSKCQNWDLCIPTDSNSTDNTIQSFYIKAYNNNCPLIMSTFKQYNFAIRTKPKQTPNYINLGCGRYILTLDTLIKNNKLNVNWIIDQKDTIKGDSLFYEFADTGYHLIYSDLSYYSKCNKVTLDSIYVSDVQAMLNPTLTNIGCGKIMLKANPINQYGNQLKVTWVHSKQNDSIVAIDTSLIVHDSGLNIIYAVSEYKGCKKVYPLAIKCNDYCPEMYYNIKYTNCGKYSFNYFPKKNYYNKENYNILIIKNSDTFVYYTNTFKHNFKDTGFYRIISKITYKYCTMIYDTNIYVNQLFNFTLPSQIYVCYGDTQTLNSNAISTNGNVHHSWNGSQKDTLNFYTIRIISDSNIYCIVKDDSNCSVSRSLQFKLLNSSIPKLLKDSFICDQQGMFLDATLQGNFSYLWNTGSVLSKIYVSKPGSYIVKITENKLGCSYIDSCSIIQFPLPKINLGNDTVFCEPFLLNSQSKGYQYIWNTGSTQDNIFVSNPGLYILKATDSNLCFSTDSIMVSYHVKKLPFNQISMPFCSNGTLQLDAGKYYIDYLWFNGSQTSSIHTSDTGWLSIKVTDSSSCPINDSVYLYHYTQPNIGFTYTYDSFYTFNFSPNDLSTVNHLWSFGDGIISNVSNPLHSYSIIGTYLVTHQYEDSNSCIYIDSQVVNVGHLSIIKPKEEINFSVIPNPISHDFYIISRDLNVGYYQMIIYDLLGNIVINNKGILDAESGTTETFNIATIPAGLYVIQFQITGSNRYMGKIIKL